jgi:phosphoribosyl-AMP cyclohydrolase
MSTPHPVFNYLDFKKNGGLIPVVVQDAKSLEVLMFAYANEEALQKSIDTGFSHFFSRSRQKLWKRGESSGHLQVIREILFDCDNDTLLYKIEQQGGSACHTGRRSCFFNKIRKDGVDLEITKPLDN